METMIDNALRNINKKSLYFSSWIFIWLLLYFFGYIEYNPTFVLLVSQFVMVACQYVTFVLYGSRLEDCIWELVYITFSKFLPLYLLWLKNDVRIRIKDLQFSVGMCVLYAIYLYYKNTNFLQCYTNIYRKVKCQHSCNIISS